jgi:cyclopropane fatty-acyl-phospholipid synthase-like methyltransferase
MPARVRSSASHSWVHCLAPFRNPRHNRAVHSDHADTVAAVRAYYEKNTRLFLALGIGRQTLALRRAVWADGVETLPQAVNYVNRLVAEEARSRAAAIVRGELRVLDIGCGVGGSLLFLANAIDSPLRGIGVTISPRQAEIARQQARVRGLSTRCVFLEADFASISGLQPFHLAFAIESFVHFPTAAAFFAAAARSLAPDGRLVLVDDFLARDHRLRKERELVRALRQGWLLPALCPVGRAVQSARDHGLHLVDDRNLSLHLSRLPVSPSLVRWAVRVMRALPVPWPYWRSAEGSLALAACQRERLIEYHCLVFEKPTG